MSGPSSTSSSEGQESRLVASAPREALGWCAVVLLAVRLLFAAFGTEWGARLDIANAAEFLRQERQSEIRVVAFGSSRMQGGFLPGEWSRLAGLQPHQVINAAVSSGRFFDALYMVRTAGGLPQSTDVVLVEIAHWNFNKNWRNPVTKKRAGVPQHVRGWGTLTDRLAVDDPRDRMKLVSEFVWPLYERRPLEQWLVVPRDPGVRTPNLPPPIPQWDESMSVQLHQNPHFRAPSIAADHFYEPLMSGFAKRNLDRLLTLLRRDGRKIVLVQLPVRDAYLDVAMSTPEGKRLYEAVHDVVRSHVGGSVSAVMCERVRDCGLDEDIFVDYGHMSREGARAFTGKLYHEVASKSLLFRD